MKIKSTKLLSLLLAGLMLIPALAACGKPDEPGQETQQSGVTGVESESEVNVMESTISSLRESVDWNGEEFGIMYANYWASYREEIEAVSNYGGETSNAVINDAVYERNTLFQEYANLEFVLVPVADESFSTALIKGIQTGTKDFYFCTQSMSNTASTALQNYLYDYQELDIDYDQEWWDQGTLEFALDGRIFLMNGAFNIVDDDCTYFVAYNKKVAEEHQVANLYQTVRDKKWTMSYLNSLISNISSDNGDGVWDEKDTYGLAGSPVIANSLFYAAGLRYVNNSPEMDTPELALDDKMDRALDVLAIARSIIHDNNSTHLGIGLDIMMADRALFGFEVISHLRLLSASMESPYGVLPVPKFDEAQDTYYSHTNPLATTMSLPTTIAQLDLELFADTLQLYCALSHKLVKPAYYEVTLMTRNVQDMESTEMLELVLQNRVYDMAAYFTDLGLSGIFETAVNGTADTFSSQYASVSRNFGRKVESMLKKLRQ